MKHPAAASPGQPDPFLARLIHLTLVTGLVASVLAMAAGLALGAAGHPALGGLLMKAGLLALLATPALRVITAVAGFVLERDWLFAAVSALVLVLLVASYLVGHA